VTESWENVLGLWKVLETTWNICKQESGNPVIFLFTHLCGGTVGRV